jgi:hypothetical protein
MNSKTQLLKNTRNQIRKFAKEKNKSRHYSEVDVQAAKKSREKIFHIINGRKKSIKTTKRYHYTNIRKVKIKITRCKVLTSSIKTGL